MSLADEILDECGDLIKEVPEAEEAIRAYRILRRRQAMAAAAKKMDADARRTDAIIWEKLRSQLLARGIGSDSFH